MSRLQEQLQARAAQESPYVKAQEALLAKYEARCKSYATLMQNKDFREYLKLEEEMNDPSIVIKKDCADPVCMALKHKIRDHWRRKQVLEKVNGAGTHLKPSPSRK